MNEKPRLTEKDTGEIEWENRELSSRFTQKLNASNPIRLCVAKMMDSVFTQGGFPSRNEAMFIILNELKNCGVTEKMASRFIQGWNRKNDPPLKDSEVVRTTKKVFNNRKEYHYSCANPKLNTFCGGKPCNDQKSYSGKKFDVFEFIEKDWQRFLSDLAKLIYFIALPALEKRQNVGVGGKVVASHRQIAKIVGKEAKYIGYALLELSIHRLIEYAPGKANKIERVASEIKRVFPIPIPPRRPKRWKQKELKEKTQKLKIGSR